MAAFGVDLGTGNIKIFDGNNYYMEKNMIAIQGKDTLLAYGDSAFEMYEKAPDNINISFPLNHGVIADIGNMQTLIHYFVDDMFEGNIKAADYYIAVPTDVTEVEKRAFYELIKDANVKARNIYVVEKAVADGLGLDIDVKNAQGVLVVDVGFDTTEISTLSLGGIVLSRLLKIGGKQFDEAIKNVVRKEHGLLIGSKTSERVKTDVSEGRNEGQKSIIYGRDVSSGLPVEKSISVDLVNTALKDNYRILVDNIRQVLEGTPPELGADIYRHGIYLTGGGSQVTGLAELIAKETGLRVNIPEEDPCASVVKGLAKIIKNSNYHSLAFSIE